MIIVRTRVSGKYSELIENPQEPNFQRLGHWVLGNVIKFVDPNKYEVKFNNSFIKEVTFNSLPIEEVDSSIPIE